MIPNKKIREWVDYWLMNSKEKLKTMKKLYAAKRYPDTIYYGHMILEITLKTLAVKQIRKPIPKSHNLRYLAELAKLSLTTEELRLIVKVNEFNMETRYPNEKLEFYKICNKNYTDEFYEFIISLHKKLCQKIK